MSSTLQPLPVIPPADVHDRQILRRSRSTAFDFTPALARGPWLRSARRSPRLGEGTIESTDR